MAIDPSIITSMAPPQAAPDPTTGIRNGLALAGGLQNLVKGGQEVQANQLALDQTKALNTAYTSSITKDADGNPTIDTALLTKALAGTPAASKMPAVLVGVNEFQKGVLDIKDLRTKIDLAGRNAIGSLAYSARTANDSPTVLLAGLAHAKEAGIIDPKVADQYVGMIHDNPDGVKQIIDQMINVSPETVKTLTDRERATAATSQATTAKGELNLRATEFATKKPGLVAEAALLSNKAEIVSAAKNNPQKIIAAVDGVIPKDDPMNQRFKNELSTVLGLGDVDKAIQVLGRASEYAAHIQGEMNPGVIGARIAQAIKTEQAMTGSGPSGTEALKGVAPHLVGQATSEKNKTDDDYVKATQAQLDLQTLIDEARKGNVVAYSFSPVEGTLQMVTDRGTTRVNLNELNAYGNAGSLYQQIKGRLGKLVSGKSIPPEILGDMESMNKDMLTNAKSGYTNRVRAINKTYGANWSEEPTSTVGPGTGSGTGTKPISIKLPSGKTIDIP